MWVGSDHGGWAWNGAGREISLERSSTHYLHVRHCFGQWIMETEILMPSRSLRSRAGDREAGRDEHRQQTLIGKVYVWRNVVGKKSQNKVRKARVQGDRVGSTWTKAWRRWARAEMWTPGRGKCHGRGANTEAGQMCPRKTRSGWVEGTREKNKGEVRVLGFDVAFQVTIKMLSFYSK